MAKKGINAWTLGVKAKLEGESQVSVGLARMESSMQDSQRKAKGLSNELASMKDKVSGLSSNFILMGAAATGTLGGLVALAPSLAAPMAELQVQMMHLGEAMSDHIAPYISGFTGFLGGITQFINENPWAGELLAGGLAGLAAMGTISIGMNLVSTAAKPVLDLFNWARNKVPVKKAFSLVKGALGKGLASIVSWGASGLNFIGGALKVPLNLAASGISSLGSTVASILATPVVGAAIGVAAGVAASAAFLSWREQSEKEEIKKISEETGLTKKQVREYLNDPNIDLTEKRTILGHQAYNATTFRGLRVAEMASGGGAETNEMARLQRIALDRETSGFGSNLISIDPLEAERLRQMPMETPGFGDVAGFLRGGPSRSGLGPVASTQTNVTNNFNINGSVITENELTETIETAVRREFARYS